MLKHFFIYFFSFIMLVTSAESSYSYTKKRVNSKWQNQVVKEMFNDPLKYGEALLWHLDQNAFAVRVPGYLFVFDYMNDNPPEVIWEYGRYLEGKDVTRSLITGVIEPKEIKDFLKSETVIVFYSHGHPAKSTMRSTFKWMEEFDNIRYVGPDEVYKDFERNVRTAVGKREISEEEREKEAEELLDLFKIAEPDKAIIFNDLKIIPLKPDYPIDEKHGIEHLGIEYVVETQNGIGMYHVGSMTCGKCVNLEVGSGDKIVSGKNELKVFTPHTKRITYQDGKMITVDGKKVGDLPGEDERLSFVMWTMEDVEWPFISIWGTYITPYGCSPTLIFKQGFTVSPDKPELGVMRRRTKVYVNEPLDQVLLRMFPPDGVVWIEATTQEELDKKEKRIDAEIYKEWALKLSEEIVKLKCNKQMMDYIINLHNGKILKKYNFGMGNFPRCEWHGVQSDSGRERGFAARSNDQPYFLGYGGEFPIFWLSSKAYKKYIKK